MTNEFNQHIHVLQIVGDPVGGIRKHIHSILNGLDEKQFYFSYSYSNAHVDAHFLKEIIYLRNRLSGELELNIRKKPHFTDIFNLWRLVRFVKKKQVDVIHGHGAKGGLYARLVGMICNVPSIYTPHGGVAHYMFGFWADKLYVLVERCLAPFTSCFIFESKYTAENFQAKVGRVNCRNIINYSGIDCSTYSINKNNKSESMNRNVNIGVFGLLRKEKGQAVLINAVAAIIRDKSINIKLHVYGDGPDRDILKKLVENLGLIEEVKFYGDVSDSEVQMTLMDIIVIPSLFESFGYVGLESMAKGKPVIATAVGGLREIFDTETAILVPAGDEGALKMAIIECIQHPESAEKMAEKAYTRCERLFSIKNMMDNLSQQYQISFLE